MSIDLGHDAFVPGDQYLPAHRPYECAYCGRSIASREWGFACERCAKKHSRVLSHYESAEACGGVLLQTIEDESWSLEAVYQAARLAARYALIYLGAIPQRRVA